MNDTTPNFWVDPDGDLVTQLADHVAALAAEAQALFAARFGGVAWQADLGEPATFTFYTDPPTVFEPSFVGSTAEDGTWMWGWHNINGFPESLVANAVTVYENGERFGIGELMTPVQPLDPDTRMAEVLPPRGDVPALYTLVTQALAADPAPIWFRSVNDSSDSSAMFILRNDAAFTLPPPTSLSVTRALTDAISSGLTSDPMLAVHAYADRRDGVTLTHAEVDRYELQTPDGAVIVRFDEHRRISAFESTISAADPIDDEEWWRG